MKRARDRKERGNPPGKQKDTLGDQITWEQLLTRCKEGIYGLWIITNDRDYCIKHGERVLLNSLLYRDLMSACGLGLEIHCYTDFVKGITEFRKKVGVSADKLPTEEEEKEIKEEIEALSSLGWQDTDRAQSLPAGHRYMWRGGAMSQPDDGAWMSYAASLAARQGVRLPLSTVAGEPSPSGQDLSEKPVE